MAPFGGTTSALCGLDLGLDLVCRGTTVWADFDEEDVFGFLAVLASDARGWAVGALFCAVRVA